MKILSRTVWILSLVSLSTDLASEMLYPVMPMFLKEIVFSMLLIGILEGVAEASAGLSKSYFGKLSDLSGRRLPFVRLGYLLSAISKPMMSVFAYPLWIFFARTMDRFGKGIRTGARDAILSDEATPETKGSVFGFHRGMDTFGAVLGPSVALIYLYYFPGSYKTLFLIAFFPGLIATLLTFILKEKSTTKKEVQSASFFSFIKYWKEAPQEYRRLLLGLLVFTLFNSSDFFILLKIKEAGFTDSAVIGVYIFYNIVYAAFAFPVGKLSDKVGFRITLVVGYALYAMVYLGLAYTSGMVWLYLLLFLYGLYAAATESVAKAWISNISDKKDTATAIGTYTGWQSVCTMLASTIAGWVWLTFGSTAVFLSTSIGVILVVIYFLSAMRSEVRYEEH
jgi:MFS family permease